MPIDDWMPVVKDLIASVDGIKQAHLPEEYPSTLSSFPCAVIGTEGGDFQYSLGGPCLTFHRLIINIYTAGQIIAQAEGQAYPFIEKVRNKMAANITLNNTVVHCLPVDVGEGGYEGPGALPYGGKAHIGVIFRFVVKEDESGTFTVSA